VTDDRFPARPALAPAIALIVGVVAGADGAPATALAAIAFSAAIAAALSAGGLRQTFVLLLCGATGAASGSWTCDRAAARVSGWLAAHDPPKEISLVGIVLRAPERDRLGERWLRLAARPEIDPHPGAPAARIRLVVRAPAAPTGLDDLRRGDRVRVFARVRAPRAPGSSDSGGLSRLAWGLDASGSVKSARLVEKLAEGNVTPGRALDELLAAARARLDRALGPDDEARHVAAAMLLGDRAGMDPDGLRALRESGLFHLLAISGLNVSLVVGAALVLLRRTRVAPWLAFPTAVAGLWAYGSLVGGEAPVLRACLAAGIALFGRTLGRDGDALNTLALVGAALAFADPPSVYHPGFQLTFAATAALLAGARPLSEAIPAPRVLAFPLGASLAAYAATAPILAAHFGRLAPVGLVSNLAAGPLCAAILGAGAAVLAAADLPIVGPAAAGLLRATVAALDALAHGAAEAPLATLRVAPSPWLVIGVAFLLVTAWRLSRRDGGGARGRLARAGAVAALLALHLGLPPRGSSASEVAVLDVGQGQAVAARDADGRCLLIDGGGSARGRSDTGERTVAPWLATWNCRRLEAIVLSHAHDDHAGGLVSVLRQFETASLWIGVGAWRDEGARALAALARERGVALRLAVSGARLEVGGLSLEFPHPAPEDAALAINDRCATVRLVTPSGATLLVPGDLEREGEERALARGENLAADALVVGHHGAGASSSETWLATVAPRLAVVSAGEGNRFGHPSPATLERLRRAGAVTFRTDVDGTVAFREEAGGWRVGAGPLRGRTGTAPE
jgi:competence protein ComEC